MTLPIDTIVCGDIVAVNEESIELTAITKLRHAALWELAKRLGGQKQAADQCLVTTLTFSNWVTLKSSFPESPEKGWWIESRWKPTKDAIESLTGQTLQQLWPKSLRDAIETRAMITTIEQTIEVPEQALLAYAELSADRFLLPSPSIHAEQDELRDALSKAIKSLTSRQQEVLKLRYGLLDGCERTLEEVGHIVGASRERVRQIEAKAIRQMQSPKSASRLVGFLE